MRKVAIDNHRIIKVEHDRVYFSYKDYADEGKIKVMDLDVSEFMRMYLLHVLPHRFVKLRCYGILGYKDRIKKLNLCKKLLEVKEDACREKEIPETWKELYEYVTGHEVGRCPYCKKGKLVYVQEILPQLSARGP